MPFLKNIGSTELIIIGIILLILFGGKKLSELARGLGESGKELKNAKKEMTNAFNDVGDEIPKKKKGGVANV
ncbi:MAG: twin-arginine translocase TatA/TatE family subunit [Candidatus Levybacteria bacterium CG_4_10_14_0_2_um_filter_35_8]|nr:MAG: twin-arginine translocase TatA/TatE family subunit [Candidatus Levybacteria bacterium CG22_combo_CG10-13_8_21_14_all_35_11]PIR56598.1 MAG: twin-arginine translocase TatA/TatE family subunit [Parcubacteria group bacterium CG10_big_fil_rev_8_21_14_0_10_41_35]PJA00125.1 MAG: twin-arginine translocase TatA/TatE family subunit [Candidatus Levybacteria bacterium CG_4_10_14_0_2_um_filter_35_8]